MVAGPPLPTLWLQALPRLIQNFLANFGVVRKGLDDLKGKQLKDGDNKKKVTDEGQAHLHLLTIVRMRIWPSYDTFGEVLDRI